jgi:hypothetical protein
MHLEAIVCSRVRHRFIIYTDLQTFISFSLEYSRGLYKNNGRWWWWDVHGGIVKDGEVGLCHETTMILQGCCSRFWITCNTGNDPKQPLHQQVLSGKEAGGYLPSEVRKKALKGLSFFVLSFCLIGREWWRQRLAVSAVLMADVSGLLERVVIPGSRLSSETVIEKMKALKKEVLIMSFTNAEHLRRIRLLVANVLVADCCAGCSHTHRRTEPKQRLSPTLGVHRMLFLFWNAAGSHCNSCDTTLYITSEHDKDLDTVAFMLSEPESRRMIYEKSKWVRHVVLGDQCTDMPGSTCMRLTGTISTGMCMCVYVFVFIAQVHEGG